jgi:hypothetical protein
MVVVRALKGLISPSPSPTLSLHKARSVFRIRRVPLGLFLPGKMSNWKPVPFDGPPTFRRPMPDVAGPGLSVTGAFNVKSQPVTFHDVSRIDAR